MFDYYTGYMWQEICYDVCNSEFDNIKCYDLVYLVFGDFIYS
jgi:hypothetical protein